MTTQNVTSLHQRKPRPAIAYTQARPIVIDAATSDISVHRIDDNVIALRISDVAVVNVDSTAWEMLADQIRAEVQK